MDYSPPSSSVHGFSRQECWGGLPFPFPGDLPDPGIKPTSPGWQADSLSLCHLGSPLTLKLRLPLIWPLEIPSKWLLCPSDLPHWVSGFVFFFFSIFILSDVTRYIKLTHSLPCSSHGISHFPKDPWFLFLENGIRDQDLGTKCAHCY